MASTMSEYHSFVPIYHFLFIYASVVGHWGCFYFLTITYNTAVNVHSQAFFNEHMCLILLSIYQE